MFVTESNENLCCKTKNLVYLIECKRCFIQYVGETKRALCERFREHMRSAITGKLTTQIAHHFSNGVCTPQDMSVSIIERMQDGTTENERRQSEKKWMLLLNTVYPLGLNDQVTGYGNVVDKVNTNKLHSHNPYFSIKVPRRPRQRGHVKHHKLTNVHDTAKKNVIEIEQKGLIAAYQILRQLPKKVCRSAYERMSEYTDNKHLQLILCSFFIRAGYQQKPKQNTIQPTRIIVPFVCKSLDKIEFEQIFKMRHVKRLLPTEVSENVQIVYKYQPSIITKVANYSTILSRMSVNEMLQLAQNSACECHKHNKVNTVLQHILTGDLNVLSNGDMRQMLEKGSKFRLDWNSVSKTDLLQKIREPIVEYANRMKEKYPVHARNIDKWIDKVTAITCTRIERHHIQSRNQQRLPQNLDERYVFAPADKASNNLAVICKKFYVQCILKELGIIDNNLQIKPVWGNDTYKYVTGRSEEDVIDAHEKLLDTYNIKISEDNRKLPRFYGIPKLHKNPPKLRYIAAAKHSSMKQLNVILCKILQFIKKHFQNYCNAALSKSGKRLYFAIDNSLEASEWLCRHERHIRSVVTADFSTLYTTLPHDLITSCMAKLIMKCYRNSGKTYIALNTRNWYCDYTHTYAYKDHIITLRKEELIDMVVQAVQQNWVLIGNELFQQTKGVPMGSNSSPDIASLTLSWLEFEHFNKQSVQQLNRHNRIFRYIDDILAVNITDFMGLAKSVYGNDLPLEQTNTDATSCAFLDLDINCENTRLRISVYDKTRDFDFTVLKYPMPDSNISQRVISDCFYAETTRYARICTHSEGFINNVTLMYNTLRNRNCEKALLTRTLTRWCIRNNSLLYKYKMYNKHDVTVKFLCKVASDWSWKI